MAQMSRLDREIEKAKMIVAATQDGLTIAERVLEALVAAKGGPVERGEPKRRGRKPKGLPKDEAVAS